MTLDPGPAPEGRRIVAADGHGYHVVSLSGAARETSDRPVPDLTEKDRTDATPLVLLHGGGPGCSGWTDFGVVAPMFASRRTVHLVDLLQYGASDKPVLSGPRWSTLATSMVSLFDAMGLERVDVVCNSWGGTIALALAAEHPQRVRALVITGSMPVLDGPLCPLPEGGRRGRNARDRYYGGEGPSPDAMRDLMARLEWWDPAQIPARTVELRYRQSVDPEEVALAGGSDDARGEPQDLSGHLRSIEAAVLFCWGMADAFLTPDYPLMLANMVPRGQLYVMDRASHHLQEERPGDFHAVVGGFLDQDHDREGLR